MNGVSVNRWRQTDGGRGLEAFRDVSAQELESRMFAKLKTLPPIFLYEACN